MRWHSEQAILLLRRTGTRACLAIASVVAVVLLLSFAPKRPGELGRSADAHWCRTPPALVAACMLHRFRCKGASVRSGPEDHPSVVPINLPTLTSLPQFGGDYRRSMLWGTYRPGLYFGG